MGRWAACLVAWTAAAATERCPTQTKDAVVNLAAYVVSRRRDVHVRDAIRSTWCDTARHVTRDVADASVIVRFFVGLDANVVNDDAGSDVTVVEVQDGASAVPLLRLYPLLRCRDWAPSATHFLAPDDDAYPFLDRIIHGLVTKTAKHAPSGRGVGPAQPVRLEDTFVWGYFMEHPAFGPWPFACGFGKVLTANLARALSAMNASVPLELGPPCLRYVRNGTGVSCDRACPGADPRIQGVCLKRTFIYEDNLLGILLTPFRYQLVHDKRFHVVPGLITDRVDGAPGIPPSAASLLVDRHDFKQAMGITEFLQATHDAALDGNYDRFLQSPTGICGLGRVVCYNNSRGSIERVRYEFTIDDKTLGLIFDDCRGARAFALSCVANASDPHGRVSLRERADRVHSFALDDCRTIAADIAAVGRATLPGSC